jgi:hypothetical protein
MGCGGLDTVAELDGQMAAVSRIAPNHRRPGRRNHPRRRIGLRGPHDASDPRHFHIQELFNRAVARGELNPETAPEPNLEQAASIVY